MSHMQSKLIPVEFKNNKYIYKVFMYCSASLILEKNKSNVCSHQHHFIGMTDRSNNSISNTKHKAFPTR